jgi:formyltetrahydrofolate-dependent phosphoribosylglycinamide formyltransferase
MTSSVSRKVRLGILISGRGSNLIALHKAIQQGKLTDAEIAVVVSNRMDAKGMEWASDQGLNVVALPEESAKKRSLRDQAILESLLHYKVDFVLLAGYDRIISNTLLDAFPGRMLNIHPSLLPAFGGPGMLGKAVHEAVLAAGELESGCTVHLVTDVVDGGAILGQNRVSVLINDTADTLAERVLNAEHQLYAEAVQNYIHRVSVS